MTCSGDRMSCTSMCTAFRVQGCAARSDCHHSVDHKSEADGKYDEDKCGGGRASSRWRRKPLKGCADSEDDGAEEAHRRRRETTTGRQAVRQQGR